MTRDELEKIRVLLLDIFVCMRSTQLRKIEVLNCAKIVLTNF